MNASRWLFVTLIAGPRLTRRMALAYYGTLPLIVVVIIVGVLGLGLRGCPPSKHCPTVMSAVQLRLAIDELTSVANLR